MYDDEDIGFGGSVFMVIITILIFIIMYVYIKQPSKNTESNVVKEQTTTDDTTTTNGSSTEWSEVCKEQIVNSKFIKGDGGYSGFSKYQSVVENNYYLQMEDGSIWIVNNKQDWGKVIVGKKNESLCDKEIAISNEFN